MSEKKVYYPVGIKELEVLHNNFIYHPPIEGQAERYTEIRELAKDFCNRLYELCPYSRERAVAVTHLEDVIFWANASIARNETEPVEPISTRG